MMLWAQVVLVLVVVAFASGIIAAAVGVALQAAINWCLRRDLARYHVVKTMGPLEMTDEAHAAIWAQADELFAKADRLFERLDEAAAPCPACAKMRELHQRYPKLSVEQLDAIVRRLIALGRCDAHHYADAPD